MDRIAFRGRLAFCSNLYPKSMFLDGLFFRTREHAFHWGKFADWKIKELIRVQEYAVQAKHEAERHKQYVRPDWYTGYSIEWMKRVVLEFFKQHEPFRVKLLGTGDEHLEERNNWGDMFWGTVDGKGRNELGKILMEVREELRLLTSPH